MLPESLADPIFNLVGAIYNGTTSPPVWMVPCNGFNSPAVESKLEFRLGARVVKGRYQTFGVDLSPREIGQAPAQRYMRLWRYERDFHTDGLLDLRGFILVEFVVVVDLEYNMVGLVQAKHTVGVPDRTYIPLFVCVI